MTKTMISRTFFGFVVDYNDIMSALELFLAEILNAHKFGLRTLHIVYIKNRFYMRSEHAIATHEQITS